MVSVITPPPPPPAGSGSVPPIIPAQTSCGCPPQDGALAGFTTREELERWFDDRLTVALAMNLKNAENDLEKLRADLKEWTKDRLRVTVDDLEKSLDAKRTSSVDKLSADINDVVCLSCSGI